MGTLFREHPVHAVSSICMSHVHAPSKMLLSCVPKYHTILLCGMYILILLFSMQIPHMTLQNSIQFRITFPRVNNLYYTFIQWQLWQKDASVIHSMMFECSTY